LPVKRFGPLALLTIAFVAMAAPSGAQTATERPISVVVLGDSLSAGFGLAGDAAFPARLAVALNKKGVAVTVGNAGVSGDTASGGLERLDWSVPDGTEAVIVELGANDMLRGVDPAVTRQALDTIIARLKARNVAVLLCGMRAAPNLGGDYVRAFNAIYPALASTHQVVFYPFFLDGVAANSALNLRDGLHPNEAGVDAIVTGIMPKVEELVARVRSSRRS
jgi:acyl-CoA thioesterase-1